MNNTYNVFPTESLSELRRSRPYYLLCNRYIALWDNGIQHEFSITRLPDGKYSLVHFNDAHQQEKHYSSFRRAYKGLLSITNRISKSLQCRG